jgi:hypothetical protein
MAGREAFQRFAQQVSRQGRVRAGNGGGAPSSIPPGVGAGGAALVALIGGGLLLNASLFNGMRILMSSLFAHI